MLRHLYLASVRPFWETLGDGRLSCSAPRPLGLALSCFVPAASYLGPRCAINASRANILKHVIVQEAHRQYSPSRWGSCQERDGQSSPPHAANPVPSSFPFRIPAFVAVCAPCIWTHARPDRYPHFMGYLLSLRFVCRHLKQASLHLYGSPAHSLREYSRA